MGLIVAFIFGAVLSSASIGEAATTDNVLGSATAGEAAKTNNPFGTNMPPFGTHTGVCQTTTECRKCPPGPKGETGDKGDKGDPGKKGDTGEKGESGLDVLLDQLEIKEPKELVTQKELKKAIQELKEEVKILEKRVDRIEGLNGTKEPEPITPKEPLTFLEELLIVMVLGALLADAMLFITLFIKGIALLSKFLSWINNTVFRKKVNFSIVYLAIPFFIVPGVISMWLQANLLIAVPLVLLMAIIIPWRLSILSVLYRLLRWLFRSDTEIEH